MAMNTQRSEQSGWYLADDIFNFISLRENWNFDSSLTKIYFLVANWQ